MGILRRPVVASLVVAVLAGLVTLVGTRPAAAEVREAAAGAAIDCAAAVDALDRLPDGFRPVSGVVAVPVEPVNEVDTSVGPPHFAKIPLAVRTGAVARITVHPSLRNAVAIQWGDTAPGSEVRVSGCEPPGFARWRVFAGGIWVDRPTCVRLEVTGERTRSVRVPVGRACP